MVHYKLSNSMLRETVGGKKKLERTLSSSINQFYYIQGTLSSEKKIQ